MTSAKVVLAVEDGGGGGERAVSFSVKMRGSESGVSLSVTETGGGVSRFPSEVEVSGGDCTTTPCAAAVVGFPSAISGNRRV